MSTMTKEELLNRAIEIRDEKDNGDNTAQRVGELLCGIVEKLDPELPGYLSYNIIPTPSSLQFGVDTTTNLYIPSSFTIRCVVEKQEEDTNTTYEYNSETGELAVDGYILYYKKIALDGTESNYTKYTGSIIVGSGDGSASSPIISVNLYLASSANGTSIEGVVRQVNIPVLRGGKARIGDPGEDAVRLNVENELDAIPCNSEGVVESEVVIRTVLSIYKGATLQTENVYIEDADVGSIEIDGGEVYGVPGQINPGVFEILWSFSLGDKPTKKRYQIPITVRYNNVPYKTTFIVLVSNGTSVMQLLPNPTQITFANNEELVTKHLKLQIQHIEGGTIELLEVAESGLNVRYSLDEMPEDDEDGTSWLDLPDPSVGIAITYNSGNNIFIAAFDSNGFLVDRETISILRDGKDGESSVGRFYYYGGDWVSVVASQSLIVNDVQAPYVEYNGNYYMCVSVDTVGIYDYAPDVNSLWKPMPSLDYVISKAVFSDYAKLGSFIINGNFLLSQKGLWSSDSIDNSESGVGEVNYQLITVSGSTIAMAPDAASKYTFIDVQHPENRVTNVVSKRTITGQTGSEIDESDTEWVIVGPDQAVMIPFEAGKLYDLSHEGLSNCHIYLRYYYSESAFVDRMIDNPGYTHALFMVQDDTDFAIVVKAVNTGSFTCTNLCLDIRNFSPNVVINGETGQVILNNVYTRGTVTGTGIFDSLVTKEAFMHGLTTIDRPKVVSDNPSDINYTNDTDWINNMEKFPVFPKYKRVALIEDNGYGTPKIQELGWITLDADPNNNGTYFLKYTTKYRHTSPFP